MLEPEQGHNCGPALARPRGVSERSEFGVSGNLVEIKGVQSNKLTALFEELEGWNRALQGACLYQPTPKP